MKRNKLTIAAIAGSALVLSLTALNLTGPATVLAQTKLYKTCEEQKLTAPLKLDAAAAATPAATMSATQDATAAAPAASDVVFLAVVPEESEACYLATESFLPNNMMNMPAGFNGAVGVTKTIDGAVALDRANLANSQIADLTINISQFKSDNDRRDGFIRQRFLESNKYPYATLTGATTIGLPARAYKDGETLQFQIKGTLTVHNTKRETVFNATGTYTSGTLVVTATTDVKLLDLGVTPPEIGGLLKVDDNIRIMVNLVAREKAAGAATAAATATK